MKKEIISEYPIPVKELDELAVNLCKQIRKSQYPKGVIEIGGGSEPIRNYIKSKLEEFFLPKVSSFEIRCPESFHLGCYVINLDKHIKLNNSFQAT